MSILPRVFRMLLILMLCQPMAAIVAGEPDTTSPEASSTEPEQPQTATAIDATRQRLSTLRDQINAIETQAKANQPALVDEHRALNDRIRAAIEADGMDLEEKQQRLDSLQADAYNDALSPEMRDQAKLTWQEERRAVMQAQREAMQKPAIQQAMSAWRENHMAAMREVDPKIDELMAAYNETIKEYSSLLHHLQSQQ